MTMLQKLLARYLSSFRETSYWQMAGPLDFAVGDVTYIYGVGWRLVTGLREAYHFTPAPGSDLWVVAYR